ncbi:uncharacterized protein VTP21DRAFT_10208 [Calcarisporiella thermophila]|uniref:uncharacterized protein n=1 Tax=Calcarisporiella thermophila TaxID=911321 RepID=UPI0037430F6C
MVPKHQYLAYYGCIVHSLALSQLEVMPKCLLLVDLHTGKIERLEREVGEDHVEATLEAWVGRENCDLIKLRKHQFLIPGFIDTHAHAPQYTFLGSGLDLPLLDWLNTYTFKREADFATPEYARDSYSKVITRFLQNGTTTAAFYGTIHREACEILVDIIREKGQRALVGKVNMDANSPDYYIETTKDSLEQTRKFVASVLSEKNELVTPVITPRFAISCSREMLSGLGKIAAEYNLPIQSHLSENKEEIAFVSELFPECKSYTEVYKRHGLLNNRTIMAHCCHLTDDEIQLMRETGAAVAHCPNSNFALQSGVCDVRRLLNEGIKVGLGTDIAGGSNASMLDAVRMCASASKVCAMRHKKALTCEPEERAESNGNGSKKENYEFLSIPEIIFLATLGGAQILGLGDKVGNFVPGKEFDALCVDPFAEGSPFDVFPHDTEHTVLEKFLYSGDDRNLKHVYVRGRRVAGF